MPYPLDMAERERDEGLRVRRPRGWRVVWAVPIAALAAVGAWFASHPEPLSTSDEPVRATTPVGVPVYVGVFATGAEPDRTLHISAARVRQDGGVAATVEVLVCDDGALAVTTAPSSFCPRLEEAAGALLGTGDQLVLRVTATSPGTVSVDQVELSYRDGLQWGTDPAGRPVVLDVLGR